ncbi:branched-chain amino acid transport [Oleidesulfovibrio alaskensis G20]|jgi:branched-subunit amino acid transport protein|uniref:Branched-chain amino acid transport n=1 Tax=Oleidesulfovibrio alaskensis (strain ATCC BAA-1058 / DSM 17464 / G20) TaxID=207559 RepID=Q317D6_OLEA2|nr:AzlD domain-containing protein [Oleidesulfovibrio alaskensis]ABB36960.1 branched-chain amino acid transport [Oleidesulfovibrio alaskensis G20]MBG0774673.1 AzlD domain-containing protein [Oleidesulfovibrio alaskensis]
MNADVFVLILGMAAVTYIPRLVPVWLLSSRSLPPVVGRWLSFVPTAVLSALLMPALVLREEHFDITGNIYFWAALPSFAVAMLTRSFFGTVAAGMATVAAARYFGLA